MTAVKFNLFKKVLIFLFVIVVNLFCGSAFAQNVIKINTINFDNSDNLIFIGTLNAPNTPINVKTGKLSNPNRIYFDIENAVLTRPNTSWSFKNSKLRQVRISQFSTNPHVVRMVIYYNNDLDVSKTRLYKLGSNLIFLYKKDLFKQDFLTNIYREQKDTSSDYYEYTSFSEDPKEIPQPQAAETVRPDGTVSQIQNAFKDGNLQKTTRIEKNFKLKSRYYVSRIDVKRGNALIRGIGHIAIENPIIVSNPTRLVFDLPNTYVAQEIRNKEYMLAEGESIKVGQFEPTKARVVITSEDVTKFRPVYSFDGQSIFFAHDDRILGMKLFDRYATIGNYVAKKQNDITDIFQLSFSAPAIHSIKRYNNRVEIGIYNSTGFNHQAFKAALKSERLSAIKTDKLPYVGLKVIIPLKQNATIEYNESFDNNMIQLVMTTPKETEIKASPTPIIKKNPNIKTIIIDAGHGGTDVGATREGIYEKDITLDISKRVEAILKKKGYDVQMTRKTDVYVGLKERVIFTEENKGDLFVSIHVNSSVSPEGHGIETHYYTPASYDFAQTVHKQLANSIDAKDRGLFKSKFYVINNDIAPSILVETGFISNPEERASLLTDKRKQKTAEAIAEGIIKYIKK